MPRDFSRTLRVAEQVQRELADLIRLEVKDPRVGMVTLTAVRVTKEFETATVFFTVMNAPEQQVRETQKVLNRAAGFLRREVGHRLSLRHVPALHFKYDESVENGMRLAELITQARAADEARKNDSPDSPEEK